MREKKIFPKTSLETLLKKAQNGKVDFVYFIQNFLNHDIIVPSLSKVIDGYFDPFLFDKEGTNMMACFTSKKLLKICEEKVNQYILLTGRQLFEQIPVGVGLVVNPGYQVGFDISPSGISSVLDDFSVSGRILEQD